MPSKNINKIIANILFSKINTDLFVVTALSFKRLINNISLFGRFGNFGRWSVLQLCNTSE